MAKRYYLCDIIGTGDETDPFRPVVADLGVSWVGSIPTDPNTGQPVFTHTLVLVAAQNHAPVRARNGVDALPDFPLDGKVNAINAATIAVMKAAMTRRGIPSSLVDGKDGYREVIRAIGKNYDGAFDENSFDIADV